MKKLKKKENAFEYGDLRKQCMKRANKANVPVYLVERKKTLRSVPADEFKPDTFSKILFVAYPGKIPELY